MGSQTRKLRARGALDSSSDVTKATRVGPRRKPGRSKWRKPAIKLIPVSDTAWSVFDDVVRESDEWTRRMLATPSPVVVEPTAEPPLRLPAHEPELLALEPRNEPAERLEALQVSQPALVRAALLAPLPGIHQLVSAAAEREKEIVRQRQVEAAGGVVLADGSAVPRTARRLPLHTVVAALAALGVLGGDVPPRGSR